ncbi:MAG: cyclic nucleotide-binding domain-containing protein [Legionella sp.]|jgi:CRP-like cAMP-binding protein
MTIFDYLSLVSYSLTALGFLMTNIIWLRIFILIACIMDANIFFFIRPGAPLWIQILMNILFAVINAVALVRLIHDRLPPGFEGEIGELYQSIFHQLAPSEFRSLLKIGEWKTIQPNVTIIHKGEAEINPMIILQGLVNIEQNGVVLTSLKKNAVLGEINFLTNLPPENAVITKEKTRLFILPKDKLLKLVDKNYSIKSVIYACFGSNIASKLKLMNEQKSADKNVSPPGRG